MIPFAHSFFFLLLFVLWSLRDIKFIYYTLKKNPKILLFILNLNQILKPKKNPKQLTSIQSSPVPVNDVQLYSYVHLIGVLRH